MKRQPTRLPSARQSSSSALVWWISSTTSVSCGRMSPSWNHRRAMPVVTITTFHEGDSGVASRSRLMTPTRSSVVPRSAWAIGRIERVLPVPVPATIPNPRRTPLGRAVAPASSPRNRSASAVSSVPCVRQSVVSRSSPNASSIVSHAARVGAMTISRRDGPDPTNASWSGGRYGSRTRRRGESIPGALYGRRLPPLSADGLPAGIVAFTGRTPLRPSFWCDGKPGPVSNGRWRGSGGRLGLSFEWFASCPCAPLGGALAASSFKLPNTTRALFGLFLMAVAQSVGAGCWLAGTFSSHTRQSPAGGWADSGTLLVGLVSLPTFSCAPSGSAAREANEPARQRTRTDELNTTTSECCSGCRQCDDAPSGTATYDSLRYLAK